MDNATKLAIYQAQVRNVRDLKVALRQLHRSINAGLRSNDTASSEAFTKIYAFLFCSWAEANFSKVIHTPHGFELDEIDQIKVAKSNGIAAAWDKCVELGLRHLDAKRGSFKPNTQQKIKSVIDSHVFDPSLLRNKLAHGQWSVALNRDNDNLSPDFTAQIQQLDIVKITAWMEGHTILADLVETLIESPKKAFMRDWYEYVVSLENHVLEFEARTLADHIARLKDKDKRTDAHAKRRGDRKAQE